MKSHSLPISAAFPELTGARLPIFWIKELRVTLPIALGGAFCIILAGLLREFLSGLGIFIIYPITCSAIVSLAFGHDFNYRTITSALALPISRQKFWWTRVSLCAALLLSLLIITLLVAHVPIFAALLQGRIQTGSPWFSGILQFIQYIAGPPLAALCLAPWLTMVSRSPMFGLVISLGVPYLIAFGTSLFGTSGYFMWAPITSISLQLAFLIGAVLSYRRFMTLEAIDSDVSLTSSRHRNPSRSQSSESGYSIPLHRSNPLWQLVKKEFMLQRLPMGIALLAIAIVFLVSREQAALLSIVYPGAIIVLVGSIASADERRMGLIPSQVSQPLPFRTQWLLKIATSYVTALLFGVLLPAFAVYYKTGELKHIAADDILVAAPFIAGGVLLILSITTYISSLSESGVRAMLASIFIIVVSFTSLGAIFNAISEYLWQEAHLHLVFFAEAEDRFANSLNLSLQFKSFLFATIGFIALAFYFAMQNHRSLERRHLLRQVGLLILYELAALAAISSFLA